MQYFPLFVDTQSLNVLIVGAGEVAARKLDLLARTKANIEVIAPNVSDEVLAYAEQGRITLTPRPVLESDIKDQALVYLATANAELNRQLAEVAKGKGVWANVVDDPRYCRFITPSIVDRGKLVIAISTAGSAPVYARDIRARLEAWLPQSLRPLFDFVAEKRLHVQSSVATGKERRLVWERFFQLNRDRFDEETAEHFEQALVGGSSKGDILLLSQDTDLELLPIGAMPLLQRIDKVLCDDELPPALLELIRRDASRAPMMSPSHLIEAYTHGSRLLIYGAPQQITQLKAAIPAAKHIQAGAL
ncbi:precorrin-2 dehydrogenase/sirohydrochlorin ferrochelatase family protein [Shewanella gelidii]|uniref:precorrin-2 dehydrogenase n=1 Tax=Shewanella gelidii TaxID=1642821 RepID=A0A917JRM9_9GAMM|nr:bifunctional precorrin-2 dehydrogenase/sirohydrochlorin ferrochelatase [Shewanella gelidii]MCL1098205.1 bifunctional precorrin-2 dehydrogenase/sirohydrochlorin ferrochelatase [Shewanella gelidii]GGI83376.1 siroheme synthase [Shewanella gelidii]